MQRIIIMAVAALLGLPASAQPPPRGSVGGFGSASILCDTKDQLQSIVDAFEESIDAAQARYIELFGLQNSRHEPTCAITPVPNVIAGEAIDLGMLRFDGQEYHGWGVHVGNRAGEGYYLYLESRFESLKNTI